MVATAVPPTTQPSRQCVVCRQYAPRHTLVRLLLQHDKLIKGEALPTLWHLWLPSQVVAEDTEIPQPPHKMPPRYGRSVYWCHTPACWEKLSRKQGKLLNRYLPVSWQTDTRKAFWDMFHHDEPHGRLSVIPPLGSRSILANE